MTGRCSLMAVTDATGQLRGWRPLGGTIEFGETAEAALRREFREEIAQELDGVQRIGVLENLYQHQGAPGHEVVFVFRAALADPSARGRTYPREIEGGVVTDLAWVPWDELGEDAPLFPEGLMALLTADAA